MSARVAKGAPIDVSTPAGVLAFAARKRAEMAADIARRGRFAMGGYAFGAWVFATHAVEGGEDIDHIKTGAPLGRPIAKPLSPPAGAADLLGPDRLTAVYGESLRRYAELSRASGALIVQEMWTACVGGVEGDALEAAERPYGWVKADPNRMEALHMRLEHKALGVMQWAAFIRRNPNRVEPWHPSATIPPELAEVDARVKLGNVIRWRS